MVIVRERGGFDDPAVHGAVDVRGVRERGRGHPWNDHDRARRRERPNTVDVRAPQVVAWLQIEVATRHLLVRDERERKDRIRTAFDSGAEPMVDEPEQFREAYSRGHAQKPGRHEPVASGVGLGRERGEERDAREDAEREASGDRPIRAQRQPHEAAECERSQRQRVAAREQRESGADACRVCGHVERANDVARRMHLRAGHKPDEVAQFCGMRVVEERAPRPDAKGERGVASRREVGRAGDGQIGVDRDAREKAGEEDRTRAAVDGAAFADEERHEPWQQPDRREMRAEREARGDRGTGEGTQSA